MVSKVRRPEEALQKALVGHLEVRAFPDVLYWHTPNGGYRTRAEAGIMKAMGQRAGIPDLFVLVPKIGSTLHIAIECKDDGKPLTPDQQEIAFKLMTMGYEFIVCKPASLDITLQKLVDAGAIRPDANAKT